MNPPRLPPIALAATLVVTLPVFAPQTVVESDAPRHPDLVTADEPLVRIGMTTGADEYLFGDVAGGVRLPDGSVVIADGGNFNVRRYDAAGRHLWTSGREGEGPGEYSWLEVLRGCPGGAIAIFDPTHNRITRIGEDGSVAGTRALTGEGVNPFNEPVCAPDGGLVYTPLWGFGTDLREVGEFYRRTASLIWARDGGLDTLRTGIPGVEGIGGPGGDNSPRTWGRNMVFAAVASGVWFGTTDDYEIEHMDWTGRITRVARWRGPDLAVTPEHADRYRNRFLENMSDPARREAFETQGWPRIEAILPERFPAYFAFLPLPDGAMWVMPHRWRAPEQELHLLDADGAWLRRLTIPVGLRVLDAGRDWVLVRELDELGVQRVEVFGVGGGRGWGGGAGEGQWGYMVNWSLHECKVGLSVERWWGRGSRDGGERWSYIDGIRDSSLDYEPFSRRLGRRTVA